MRNILIAVVVMCVLSATRADACSPLPVDPFTRFDGVPIVAIGRVQGDRLVVEERLKGPARPWFALERHQIGTRAAIDSACSPILANGSRVLLFLRPSQSPGVHHAGWAERPNGAIARVLRQWRQAHDAPRRAELLASLALGPSRSEASFAVMYLRQHRRLLVHMSADDRTRLEPQIRARRGRRVSHLDF